MATVANSSKWLFASKTLKLSLPARLRSKSKPATAAAIASPSSSAPAPKLISTKEGELRRVFCYFDNNNDGKISVEELRAYFVSVGDSMSQEEAQRLIKEFDKDGDNLLEFADFVRLMEHDDIKDDEDIKKAFEMFEVEKGSGCITPKGLQLVLNRLGDAKSFDQCKAMIRVFDLDDNGVLDFHEFYKMMA